MEKKKTIQNRKTVENNLLPKTPTGINGLDEITEGGFPKGRPVLVCGSAGCGKTLMAAQFIVRGITDYNEPGVFMSFEESGNDLAENVKSLGFDLEKLKEEKKLRIDFVRIERSEIEETGEYDLEALFIRLNYAIDSIGAKRVVLDTIEAIFSGVENQAILRSEIRRLFHWLKEKGVTALITGERGQNSLTRQGLEEYVSDCVILLDFRVIDQIATRRLRIVKYRGSTHGTNEYPFLIDENGISALPITSLKLNYPASDSIISTGLPMLDKLFYRGGIYKGSSILITGTAGTAKTTIAAYFTLGACKRKERAIYFSFEESPEQIIRNMAEIGINLRPHFKSKLLHIKSSRPTLQGLEMHLLLIQKAVEELKPQTVIIDPISSLAAVGSGSEVRAMLVRVLDILKIHQINAVFTALTHHAESDYFDATIDAVSSLSDTWINLKNEGLEKDVVRSLRIVKSRGTGYTGNHQDFIITDKGIRFLNVDKK
jgi:circadian clock protein KaiC